jgi:hypothetical protein
LHLFSGIEIAVGSTKFKKLARFRKISPRIPVFVDPCNIRVVGRDNGILSNRNRTE